MRAGRAYTNLKYVKHTNRFHSAGIEKTICYSNIQFALIYRLLNSLVCIVQDKQRNSYVLKIILGVSSAASAFASLRVSAAQAGLLRGTLSLPPRPRCPVAEPGEAQRGRSRFAKARALRIPHPI
ncbi:MAG: hypothetical protein NZ522_07570 [Chitinophagales bacterium]|nr:hypothetical protein [Chitinophagales bacterium]